MKPSRLLPLIAILALLAWWLWPEEPPRYPTAGSTVVVFGDSLAAGTGASASGDIASRLEAQLGREVINLGVPGDTTADGLARTETVLAADPHVVIMILGGNDAIRRTPIEETFSNLAEMITQFHKAGAAVILVGAPGGFYGNQYEKEYERLAKTHRTFYLPNILSGLIGRSEYMSDLVHPNDAGYAIAAERLLPLVTEALSGTP